MIHQTRQIIKRNYHLFKENLNVGKED